VNNIQLIIPLQTKYLVFVGIPLSIHVVLVQLFLNLILIKLNIVYYLRRCMKKNKPGQNYFKGDNM